MATLAAANLDPASKQAWSRLLIASALSLVAHLALLLGMPVNPTGGVPFAASTIQARLEPASTEFSVDTKPPPDMLLSTEKSISPTAEDVQAKKVETEAEPTSEPRLSIAPPSSPSGGIELPLIRDPTYYPAKQLDVYPQPLTAIKLSYPDTAAAARVDGRLLVLLLIDEFGVVNEASIVESQPEGYFEEAALSVFRAIRFSPAQKQGHAVKSRVLLQVRYIYGDSQGAVR